MEITYRETGQRRESKACIFCGEPIIGEGADLLADSHEHPQHTIPGDEGVRDPCPVRSFVVDGFYVSPFPVRRHHLEQHPFAVAEHTDKAKDHITTTGRYMKRTEPTW